MTITGEIITLYMAIMVPILGGMVLLWGKSDAVWKAINQAVTHETCEKRRTNCPCVRELERLKEDLGNKPRRRKAR